MQSDIKIEGELTTYMKVERARGTVSFYKQVGEAGETVEIDEAEYRAGVGDHEGNAKAVG